MSRRYSAVHRCTGVLYGRTTAVDCTVSSQIVVIISRHHIAWPLLWAFCSCRWIGYILVRWWTFPQFRSTNIWRHTRPVVCDNRCQSFWYGPWCFATVRSQNILLRTACVFLISHGTLLILRVPLMKNLFARQAAQVLRLTARFWQFHNSCMMFMEQFISLLPTHVFYWTFTDTTILSKYLYLLFLNCLYVCFMFALLYFSLFTLSLYLYSVHTTYCTHTIERVLSLLIFLCCIMVHTLTLLLVSFRLLLIV